MYKLVAVGGKLRGEEYNLEEGECILGRDPECDIQLNVNGISKKHLSLTVTSDVLYIADLGSSNGTFVNGKIVTRATLQNGDKIALPDLILQVVYVKEKKILIKKRATAEQEDTLEQFLGGGETPTGLLPKIIHLFRFKLMPFIYGVNEEYEWKHLLGILIALFVVLTITLTIFPVLRDSKNILLYETSLRGAHYADEIGRMNRRALENRNLDQVDSNFLKNEDGVADYDLFDLEGRIVRPIERLNEYIESTLSIRALEWAKKPGNEDGKGTMAIMLSGNEIGIAKKIIAYNTKTASFEPVGIIAIKFRPKSLAVEATNSSKAYLESLMTSFIVAIIFFAIIFYLTLRPFDEMRFQLEEALRGKRKELSSKYLMSELKPLRNSINSALQRIRELSRDGDDVDFGEIESDESYVSSLKEILVGTSLPTMILNSEKNLAGLNSECEDITSIRADASLDMSLLDVAREKGFAATIIELCDASANNGGTSQSGEYELQGIEYTINVSSLLGKDNFAKAFYISFVRS